MHYLAPLQRHISEQHFERKRNHVQTSKRKMCKTAVVGKLIILCLESENDYHRKCTSFYEHVVQVLHQRSKLYYVSVPNRHQRTRSGSRSRSSSIDEEVDVLPITKSTDEILSAIREHQVVIISGETGSGKSTQIPKMLLKNGYIYY